MKINCKTCLNATGTNRSEPHHTTNPVSDDRRSLLKACSHRPLCLRVHSRPDVTRVRCCVGLCSLPHTSCFSCPTQAAHSRNPRWNLFTKEKVQISQHPPRQHPKVTARRIPSGGARRARPASASPRGTAYPHVGALHPSSATRSVLRETQRKVTVV